MKGTLQIAKLFKIPVLLHWSFGLLFFYVFYIGNKQHLDSRQMLWLGLFVLAMFVCILFHEFGHALTARRFGVGTKDIILLPIGGLARLDKLPEKPMQEFLVALAGPLVNVGIAFLLCGYFFFVSFTELFSRDLKGETDLVGDFYFFVPSLIFLNLVLAIFNLLPAFPMDGGRVLRALLSTKLGRKRATRIASLLGQFLAVLMFVYGLWEYSFTTVFIGVFIFFTAYQENKAVKMESLLPEISVKEIYSKQFMLLRMDDNAKLALDFLANNARHSCLVVDKDEQLAGSLPNWALMGPAVEMSDKTVADFYIPDTRTVNSGDSLKEANLELQLSASGILPVLENGKLVGVIDNLKIMEALSSELKPKRT